MKRRNFLKYTAALTPLMLNGVSLRAFSPNLADCAEVQERSIVMVQLAGGNDGLNTFIPLNQYATYANLRPNIRISDTGAHQYIDLDTTLAPNRRIGLHPVMSGFKTLYDQGKVAIVQGVGYPSFNRSHFKSTDLWLTGGDGTPQGFNHSTGWMGRYLDSKFPNVQGQPTADMPDPLAIELGAKNPSVGFHTDTQHRTSINLTGQDLAGYYTLVSEIGGAMLANVPNSHYGNLIQHVMNVETGMSVYAQRITDVFNKGGNLTTYPSTNLANQLKTVARLIHGGCKTKIYLVKLQGFDTHNAQAVQGSPETGFHADLLTELVGAINTFQTDLGALGIEDKVLTVTFSEFGRKAIENGNLGTDHGNWAPMMLFGKHVQPGVLGDHLNLSNLSSQGLYADSLTYDYRQVFTTILQDWLGADDNVLTTTLFDPYLANKLPLIDPNKVADLDCFTTSTGWLQDDDNTKGLTIFPNPARNYFTMSLHADAAFDAKIRVIDLTGKVVVTEVFDIYYGKNDKTIGISSLPAGYYIVQLTKDNEPVGQVFKLVKV